MDEDGLVSVRSESIGHGITVWIHGGKTYWVVKYPILMLVSALIFISMLAYHILNFGGTSWLTMIFEYNHPIAAGLYSFTISSQQEEINRVSRALDLWWRYAYLEKELEQLKRRAADKVKKFIYVYYNFMVLGGITYGLQPLWRYYKKADDYNNLLLFHCWTPFPLSTWWGFSVTYLPQLITTLTAFVLFGSIITYLISAVMTIGNQFQLIGISVVTVDQRVSKAMGEAGLLEDWAGVRTLITQKELRNSAIHFQRIYRLAEEVCEFFTGPINLIYYPGIFVLVVCCGKLPTERENKFLLFQVTIMSIAILASQYAVVYVNQILTDQMENLRFSIYDSKWYLMQIPCRKTIHIMQSMVLRKPNIKTMLGANADREFFARVCNATYRYLSALLSMNIKY